MALDKRDFDVRSLSVEIEKSDGWKEIQKIHLIEESIDRVLEVMIEGAENDENDSSSIITFSDEISQDILGLSDTGLKYLSLLYQSVGWQKIGVMRYADTAPSLLKDRAYLI